jgi:protein JSN1
VPTKAPTPLIVGPEEAAPLTIAGAAVAGQGASATSAIAAAAAPVAPAGGQEGPLEQVLDQVKGATSVSTEQQLSAEGGGVENYRSPLVMDLVKAGVAEQVLEKGLAKGGVVSEGQMIMAVLGGGRSDEDGDIKAAAGAYTFDTFRMWDVDRLTD